MQTGIVVKVSLSFARLSVPQIFGLHPKGACLWGSFQAIPVCPRDLLQLFTMGACTVTPHTDDHIHVLFLAQREALPCFPLVLCPPISHALSWPSTSMEMLVGFPGCPVALGTPHPQLEILSSTSGEALWVTALCIKCPALLSAES